MPSQPDEAPGTDFDAFFRVIESRLRQVLVARHGPDRGRDATAEALLWAYETWPRSRGFEHPVAYLARVGTSRTRLRRRGWLEAPVVVEATPEPELVRALKTLSPRQREVVVLVCAYQWRQTEVAEMLEASPATVATHLRRGLERLRSYLGVDEDELAASSFQA